MIAADTNVLVRLFVPVEPQRDIALKFFANRSPADPAFIPLIVVAEFAWVLKRRYKYGFEQISESVQRMLDSDDFVVENRDRVEWAITYYKRSRMDLADLLIARSSEIAGASWTATFDTDAVKDVPGMELLK